MSENRIETYSSKTLVEHISDTIAAGSTIRYCFVLGAGASKSSGIKTGAELAEIWFEDIKRIFPDNYEKWMRANKVNPKDLASSYGKIYEKRFELNRVEGYEFIQSEIENSEPSYGYSILARLLRTNHNVVITTNFDPLTEDALLIYSDKRPLVCGHESLSEFVRPTSRRPVIIKIHRDQLLAPKNAVAELSVLDQGFKDSLDRILQTYKPIVIGYGGNDPSLMNYLNECSLLNGIFWCKRPSEKLSPRIKDLLHQKGGKIFEISGFDEFMLQIHASIFKDMSPLDELLLEGAKGRAEAWGKQFAELTDVLQSSEAKLALSKLIKGKQFKSWWDVIAASNAEQDFAKRTEIYKLGFDAFPRNHSIARNLAIHYEKNIKDYDLAEEMYEKAVEYGPEVSFNWAILGEFLNAKRGDKARAEKAFTEAIERDPEFGYSHRVYADFLYEGHEYDQAERHYEKAVEASSDNAFAHAQYARFLARARADYEKAGKYYAIAARLDDSEYYQNLLERFVREHGNLGEVASVSSS